MKSFSRVLSLVLLFLATSFLQAAEPLRFVAWNIEWFPGHRPTASAEEAAKQMKDCQEALKKLNPDIFVAEEIHDWDAFHELVSAVPGLVVHVVSSFRDPETGQIRDQQIGIASKLKCHGAWWEAWAANYPGISRGFSYAALEHPDGGLLMIYGNHLKSNSGGNTPAGATRNAEMRNEQVKQLLAHKTSSEKAYGNSKIMGWIVAGDMNTNQDGQFPEDSVVKTMIDGGYFNTWKNVEKDKRLSWRGDEKFEGTTFDYIFTQGIKEVDARILDVSKECSDHCPIGIPVMAP